MAHAPEPWTCHPNPDEIGAFWVDGPIGLDASVTGDTIGRPICAVWGKDNAALIAAAPETAAERERLRASNAELLAALERSLDALLAYDGDASDPDKATGWEDERAYLAYMAGYNAIDNASKGGL